MVTYRIPEVGAMVTVVLRVWTQVLDPRCWIPDSELNDIFNLVTIAVFEVFKKNEDGQKS